MDRARRLRRPEASLQLGIGASDRAQLPRLSSAQAQPLVLAALSRAAL